MLTASDAQPNDSFGYSVAVAGNVAVVGANAEDSASGNAGAAYIFERNFGGANNWGEILKLTAYNAMAAEYFGSSIDVDGNGLIVGGMYRAYISGCNINYGV